MPGLSRASLIGSLALLVWTSAPLALDPHVDPGLIPGQCRACHAGHGESGSPMLPAPQSDVCLSCHGSESDRRQMVGRGMLAPSARPQLMSSTLAQPYLHPIAEGAFSRDEVDRVTCTSCHSPHRRMQGRFGDGERKGGQAGAVAVTGTQKLSPRDPIRFEYEMCGSCHAGERDTRAGLEAGDLVDPNNRSYHPVESTATSASPSLRPELRGKEINCTDCHGNDDPRAIPGPHASNIRFLLRSNYTTVDGENESESTYALCYDCHDRGTILKSPVFPGHNLHITKLRASCATCHSAHGSLDNRALIRFGEEKTFANVAPSIEAGILAFESDGPGAGSCYVTCHGFDHAPEGYGGLPASDEKMKAVPKRKSGSKVDRR